MQSETDLGPVVTEIVTGATDKIKKKLDTIEASATAKYKSGVMKTRQGLLTCADAVHSAQEKMIAASKVTGGMRYNEWLSKMKISQSTAERWLAVHEQRDFIKALPVISDSATVYYEFARLHSEKDQAKALKALGETPKAITASEAKELVNAITYPNPKTKPSDNQLPVLTEMMGSESALPPEPEDDLGTGPIVEPSNEDTADDGNIIEIVEEETDWLLSADRRTHFIEGLRAYLSAYELKGIKVTVERIK